jgi:amidase
MAGDFQADNPLFGRTNNPWALDRTPGGSTGGGGAAVAAGLSPLELGSDNGGSLRAPAAFCGVYGHKPSAGAVPNSGHFPGSVLPNPATVLAAQGPLARSAEDLALALGVIAGPDVGEDAAWRLTLPPARRGRLADFRVAVLPQLSWVPVDDDIVAAQERLAVDLDRAGATVAEGQPEGLGDLRGYVEIFCSLLMVMGSVGIPEEVRHQIAEGLRGGADEFGPAWAAGLVASAAQHTDWLDRREQYKATFRAFFRDWDVLLAPTTIIPAFLHTILPPDERTYDVNGQTVCDSFHSVYPALATLTGQPDTVFPAGTTRTGLPIALQVVGPYLEDYTPIRFAALVAQGFGGYSRPPGYDAP